MHHGLTDVQRHAAALTLGGAVALALAACLTWFELLPIEWTAWQGFTTPDLLIAATVAAGLTAAVCGLRGSPRLAVPAAIVTTGLAFAALVAVIATDPPSESARAAGFYLGCAAAAWLGLASAVLAYVSHDRPQGVARSPEPTPRTGT
jgi:peptidoglycan/LPS O-acetylase OafA/YrhL